ncbi:WD repeat-containing protein 20 isoform X7 [Homo sapiens]|uniref:WD repeat-containing protein 20 isoform X7 n=1 Tax=Homo sapiens TaxID=9606 RepID=UPI0005D00EA0|nr:WD repeat-containing protein 20 isoform X7 [Homo sapiens]XP_054232973.1 WD repeat-containing protein 20 isoform X7 [Homo sapiens]|eukprot:XP_011535642.1 WD repeat-containing protein 20 isoform X6 [Homo sapiens]
MATEGGGKEMNEIKTQFTTREGLYKLLPHSEYSRPNRVPFNSQGSNPVRVSFVNLNDQSGNGDRLCFNVGRELYFYIYKGVRKVPTRASPEPASGAADLSKPIDKRIYKGTQPTCHDFNHLTATAESVSLLVGFSAGQVQLIDPIKKETSKLFNEENSCQHLWKVDWNEERQNEGSKTSEEALVTVQRLIDKSRVTCVKWVPGSESLFLVAHSSGNMYLYNVEHTCGTTAPHYQLLKQGESFAVHTCKSKSTRNPLLKWTVGEGALNEFAFSPDGKFLACVSQDGFLRVFNFDSVELHGTMKSYFGGLLCVCWSPDGKYIVTGGEDDLVTVWSFVDCRVIARGHGHKSWVSVVAFDPYTTSVEEGDPMEFSGSDEDFQDLLHFGRDRANSTQSRLSKRNSTDSRPVSVTYRFGSVGQDTQLCLWDLTEDILFPHQPLSRARTHTNVMNATSPPAGSNGNSVTTPGNSVPPPLPRSNSLPHSAVSNAGSKSSVMDGAIASGVSKFATLSLHDRKERHHEKDHKRNHSMGHISSKSSDKLNLVTKTKTDPAKTLGTPLCPRMEDVPLLEPLICKKIAHERLTVLIFLEDCIVTACQEGFICTWGRPGKVLLPCHCHS